MPKKEAPKKEKDTSSSSDSDEEEEVAEEVAAPKATPPAGIPKSAPPAPPRRGRAREASEAGESSSDRAPRARGHRSPSPVDPPAREDDKGSPSPEERAGRVRCPICWASVANSQGGISQHQYFNQTCNAWRYYQQGYPWPQAVRYARVLKYERDTEHWDEPTEPKRSGSVAPVARSSSVMPARSKEQRLRLEEMQGRASSSGKPAFELMAALQAMAAAGLGSKKEEEKKDKKRKRHRHRKRSSPTPEVERKPHGRKRPPSDDDMDDPGLPQIKRGKDGSFIVRFPANAVH